MIASWMTRTDPEWPNVERSKKEEAVELKANFKALLLQGFSSVTVSNTRNLCRFTCSITSLMNERLCQTMRLNCPHLI
jgi:hypothetical protein